MSQDLSSVGLVIFEGKNIRRKWHNEQWYFSVVDIVAVLAESANPSDYIKKLRKRDDMLNEGWGQIVTPLTIQTAGGKQKVNCSNTEGLFRIIQSIPSKKAESFKRWLAKVGHERLQEMSDPSLAIDRGREYWKKHGRSEGWIQQRMMGQETRNKLTDRWKESDIKEGEEFAILTNIIHEEWSGFSVNQHKKFKNLTNQNLRDHMNEEELIFTALAELSTRKIAETENAIGMTENKAAAKKGGNIAKKARLDLENKTGKKVVSQSNFLPETKETAIFERVEKKSNRTLSRQKSRRQL